MFVQFFVRGIGQFWQLSHQRVRESWLSGILWWMVCGFSVWGQLSDQFFGLQFVDSATGRGIPLVIARTTNAVQYVSDSQGWIAFHEPGMMDQEVYFDLQSPGYDVPADGFGVRGIRVITKPGGRRRIELKRWHLAERIYRVTGQGIYRDSQLLNESYPREIAALNGSVTGQDSVQMVPFNGRLFWLWGDTNLANYPLGNYRATGATSLSPGNEGLQPNRSISLDYFIGQDQRVRPLFETDQPGAVWLFGLVNVPDNTGRETLVAHYSRNLKLGQTVEQGLAVWKPAKQIFEKQLELPLSLTWQVPRGNAVRVQEADAEWVYFAEPFAVTRVPATLEAMLRVDQYQSMAWSAQSQAYQWQSMVPPTTQPDEAQWIEQSQMRGEAARYQLQDVETAAQVTLHRASINWNPYRQRWILVGCEITNRQQSPSQLGEIWYAESTAITGPWKSAIKIATHPGYSFYNPRHHAPLDEENGRWIYFEGTYTREFSGSTNPAPRYDYNQIMYRLDLSQLPAEVLSH